MTDAWRLAFGTLTAIRVRPPTVVDPGTARGAVLLAPVAVVPLGVVVGLVLWVGNRYGLPDLACGVLAILALTIATRALHVDGLSDVADGFAASYNRDRALEVMRSGSSGPAGTIATILVVGVQIASAQRLSHSWQGCVVAGALVCASRWALLVTCAAGVPGAREDGLGTAFVGSVPMGLAVAGWVLLTVVTAVLVAWLGEPWWRGALTAVAAVLVVIVLVRRAVTRFGGVTGDVFGAGIELALAVLLLGSA